MACMCLFLARDYAATTCFSSLLATTSSSCRLPHRQYATYLFYIFSKKKKNKPFLPFRLGEAPWALRRISTALGANQHGTVLPARSCSAVVALAPADTACVFPSRAARRATSTCSLTLIEVQVALTPHASLLWREQLWIGEGHLSLATKKTKKGQKSQQGGDDMVHSLPVYRQEFKVLPTNLQPHARLPIRRSCAS